MTIDPGVLRMLDAYKMSPVTEKQRLREIIQQCALLGLARNGFFEHAAFYGGTALRILYGLDRFSEDLDFSLFSPQHDFSLSPYVAGVERELNSLGFEVQVEEKEKSKETPILSAFIKGNTKILLLSLETNREMRGIHPDEKLKIKFEIDSDPPCLFEAETKLVINPVPFNVVTLQLPDLFAGKTHAALFRAWKGRIKGRDWYDFIWFLQQDIPVRLSYMESCMKQNDFLKDKKLKHDWLISLLKDKIQMIDWEKAAQDVRPFLARPSDVDIWSVKFFLDLLPRLKTI